MKKLFTYLIPVLLVSCGNNDNPSDNPVTENPPVNNGIAAPKIISASLMAEYPHDTTAFTEGLFIHDGKMYEGTGLKKESFISIYDIKTGKIEKKYPVKDESIFGEGINIINGKLYQLTYQNNIVFVYDVKDLSKPIKTFPWNSEGWGMTNNGTELIISDGSKEGKIYFVNPADFRIKRIIQVTDNNGPVNFVNELEYIDGTIFANVWGETFILQIDPANGHVIGKLETADLLKGFHTGNTSRDNDAVLNGIAYDSTSKRMYITGKHWPKLFELKLN